MPRNMLTVYVYFTMVKKQMTETDLDRDTTPAVVWPPYLPAHFLICHSCHVWR